MSATTASSDFSSVELPKGLGDAASSTPVSTLGSPLAGPTREHRHPAHSPQVAAGSGTGTVDQLVLPPIGNSRTGQSQTVANVSLSPGPNSRHQHAQEMALKVAKPHTSFTPQQTGKKGASAPLDAVPAELLASLIRQHRPITVTPDSSATDTDKLDTSTGESNKTAEKKSSKRRITMAVRNGWVLWQHADGGF